MRISVIDHQYCELKLYLIADRLMVKLSLWIWFFFFFNVIFSSNKSSHSHLSKTFGSNNSYITSQTYFPVKNNQRVFNIFFRFNVQTKWPYTFLPKKKKKSDLIPNCTTVLRVSHMDSSWVPAQHWIQTNAKIYINNKFHKNFPNLFTVVNSDFETQETKWKQS